MADADSDPAYHLPFNFFRICNTAKYNNFSMGTAQIGQTHMLNKEVDLQKFICDVHSCTHWLWPRNSPLPPHLDSYTRALLVSKERRHLFATPWTLWTDLKEVPHDGGDSVKSVGLGLLLPQEVSELLQGDRHPVPGVLAQVVAEHRSREDQI